MVAQLNNHIKNYKTFLDPEHPAYKWLVLTSVMIGTFMAVLDATIVNVGLPKMMAAFGTDIDKIEWVLTAYLLIFAVMLPSSGWVADHFGYKRTYFMGLAVFTIGSLLCSLAWNEDILIAFRVIQGAGAGFVMPVGMAIVTREFPPEQRGTALGFWGVAAAGSISIGPLIGGYLIDEFSWHAIFDINVPTGLFALVVVYIVQREYKTESKRKFDLVGFLSMTIFLTTLLLALASGNANWNVGGWTSNFITANFFISAIALVVFIVNEINIEHPIVELRLLKNWNFGITNIILFIFGVAFFGNTFLLPLFLQNSLGYTALQAGLVFFPVGILQAIVSPIAGKLTDKVNPKIPIAIGVILLGISLYLSGFFSLQTERPAVMLPLYIRGLALGLIFIPLSTIALLEMPREKMAQATGLFNTIRQIGGSFGVAILGTYLTQRVAFHKEIYSQAVDPNSEVLKNAAIKASYFVQNAIGGTAQEAMLKAKALIARNLYAQAFVQGINDDFLLGAIFTISLLIPLFFLRFRKNTKSSKIEIME